MANGFIGQVNIGSDSHLIGSTLFATSSTVGDEGAKIATLQGSAVYSPTTGITIHVKFTHGNTVTNGASLTLKVGSDDARSIVNPNGALTWNDNSIISFTFDGTNWIINSSGIDASSTSLTLGNISSSGTLTNTAATIATGDYLVITDASDNSGRIAKANLSFDTTKTDYYLSQTGSWTQVNKTTLGINSVTNHAQVTSLQWDNTDKKITYKVSEGTANDLLTFVQGSNITLTAAPGQITITGSNNKVTQTHTTESATYDLLFSSSTSTTSTKTEGARKHSGSLTYNPFTGILTATKFSGDGSGLTNVTASSVVWDNISGTPTTLSGYGITDALSSSASFSIAGNTIDFNTNNSLDASTLRTSLGLSSALRFIGTVASDSQYMPSDGTSGTPTITGLTSYTPTIGDVVLDKDGNAEYVCTTISGTTYTWELLGRDSSFALDSAVIHNSLLTTTGDIIYRSSNAPARLEIGTAGQVLTVSGGVPVWADNAATDKKVEQKGLTTSGDYPILLKYDTGTSDVTANYVNFGSTSGKGLTFNPSSGALKATSFEGALQASAVKTALGTETSSALIFLHKSGDWKTLSVTNTTTTVASVSGGVLTLVASVAENATLGMAAVT